MYPWELHPPDGNGGEARGSHHYSHSPGAPQEGLENQFTPRLAITTSVTLWSEHGFQDNEVHPKGSPGNPFLGRAEARPFWRNGNGRASSPVKLFYLRGPSKVYPDACGHGGDQKFGPRPGGPSQLSWGSIRRAFLGCLLSSIPKHSRVSKRSREMGIGEAQVESPPSWRFSGAWSG
jgi:hypothetical protein